MPITFIALLLASLLSIPTVSACTCDGTWEPKRALGDSAAVFTGTVREIRDDWRYRRVTFEVDRVWKGPVEKTIVVASFTPVRPVLGLCTGQFAKGKKYIVFAREQEMAFVADVEYCGGTQELSRAQAVLQVIGAGAKVR